MSDDNRILDCGHAPSAHSEHTTGTAHTQDGKEICWDCCANNDRQMMIETGTSRSLPLYVTGVPFPGKRNEDAAPLEVTNWPGTLRFKVTGFRRGYHNIGCVRFDVWFDGPDGFVWHGVNIGEWNSICHAKRTKERARATVAT